MTRSQRDPDGAAVTVLSSSVVHLHLIGKVPMAVGMSDSIGDADALNFATRFYRTLAEGPSVSAALATARADMEMNGLPDYDLPVLAGLDSVDPTLVRLIVPSE